MLIHAIILILILATKEIINRKDHISYKLYFRFFTQNGYQCFLISRLFRMSYTLTSEQLNIF